MMGLGFLFKACLRPAAADGNRGSESASPRSKQGVNETTLYASLGKQTRRASAVCGSSSMCNDFLSTQDESSADSAHVEIFRALVNASPTPVSLFSSSGRILLRNVAASALPDTLSALFGLDPASLNEALAQVAAGQCWRGLIHMPPDRAQMIGATALPSQQQSGPQPPAAALLSSAKQPPAAAARHSTEECQQKLSASLLTATHTHTSIRLALQQVAFGSVGFSSSTRARPGAEPPSSTPALQQLLRKDHPPSVSQPVPVAEVAPPCRNDVSSSSGHRRGYDKFRRSSTYQMGTPEPYYSTATATAAEPPATSCNGNVAAAPSICCAATAAAASTASAIFSQAKRAAALARAAAQAAAAEAAAEATAGAASGEVPRATTPGASSKFHTAAIRPPPGPSPGEPAVAVGAQMAAGADVRGAEGGGTAGGRSANNLLPQPAKLAPWLSTTTLTTTPSLDFADTALEARSWSFGGSQGRARKGENLDLVQQQQLQHPKHPPLQPPPQAIGGSRSASYRRKSIDVPSLSEHSPLDSKHSLKLLEGLTTSTFYQMSRHQSQQRHHLSRSHTPVPRSLTLTSRASDATAATAAADSSRTDPRSESASMQRQHTLTRAAERDTTDQLLTQDFESFASDGFVGAEGGSTGSRCHQFFRPNDPGCLAGATAATTRSDAWRYVDGQQQQTQTPRGRFSVDVTGACGSQDGSHGSVGGVVGLALRASVRTPTPRVRASGSRLGAAAFGSGPAAAGSLQARRDLAAGGDPAEETASSTAGGGGASGSGGQLPLSKSAQQQWCRADGGKTLEARIAMGEDEGDEMLCVVVDEGQADGVAHAAALEASTASSEGSGTASIMEIDVWHEVMLSGLQHPGTGDQLILVMQFDVSARVWAEQQLARVMEAEHALLEAIFPAHVLEHIAIMAAAPVDDVNQDKDGQEADVATGADTITNRPHTLDNIVADATAAATQAGLRGLGPVRAGHAPSAGLAAGPGRGASASLPITGDTMLHLATSHSAVTILFCDIQGFTAMCNVVRPATVMAFLNDLFTRLDAMLDAFGVYKVETIGDCYMVAGGLMKVDEETGAVTVRSDDVDPQHAHRTVQFGKALLRAASSVRLPTTGEAVRLRVGIHSGPAMSGVVGTRMPRFCLFGDTINTASRMESTGESGAIHVSQATRDLVPGEAWEATGGVQAKGKGCLETYLLRPLESD